MVFQTVANLLLLFITKNNDLLPTSKHLMTMLSEWNQLLQQILKGKWKVHKSMMTFLICVNLYIMKAKHCLDIEILQL